MTAKNETTEPFPTYKGKPLVRSGDTIYYGSMKDPYVVKMDIKTKKEVAGEEIADEIHITLMRTSQSIGIKKQIVKTSKKNGFYLAMDIAEAWLERALASRED